MSNGREEIMARLERLLEPETVTPWLRAPNQAFDGRTPEQLLNAGELEPLLRMLDQIESGAYL